MRGVLPAGFPCCAGSDTAIITGTNVAHLAMTTDTCRPGTEAGRSAAGAGISAGSAVGTTVGTDTTMSMAGTRTAATGTDPDGRATANVDTAAVATVAASRTQGSVWRRTGVCPP